MEQNIYFHIDITLMKQKPGVYTRIKGLARAQKELILNHIKKEGKGHKEDFIDVFPELKKQDIANLLQELKSEGKNYSSRLYKVWILEINYC